MKLQVPDGGDISLTSPEKNIGYTTLIFPSTNLEVIVHMSHLPFLFMIYSVSPIHKHPGC